MATLETQYKNFMSDNPDSKFTHIEWLEWYGNQLISELKKIDENSKKDLVD
jgi:hypothetical protein